MLAQNFMTAGDLGISEVERDALVKVLGMLERGELKYAYPPVHGQIRDGFNMRLWGDECDTVHCIGGWAKALMGENFTSPCNKNVPGLGHLFYVPPGQHIGMHEISVEQAASATRNYLTLGEPRWQEVLSS